MRREWHLVDVCFGRCSDVAEVGHCASEFQGLPCGASLAGGARLAALHGLATLRAREFHSAPFRRPLRPLASVPRAWSGRLPCEVFVGSGPSVSECDRDGTALGAHAVSAHRMSVVSDVIVFAMFRSFRVPSLSASVVSHDMHEQHTHRLTYRCSIGGVPCSLHPCRPSSSTTSAWGSSRSGSASASQYLCCFECFSWQRHGQCSALALALDVVSASMSAPERINWLANMCVRDVRNACPFCTVLCRFRMVRLPTGKGRVVERPCIASVRESRGRVFHPCLDGGAGHFQDDAKAHRGEQVNPEGVTSAVQEFAYP